MSSLHWGGDKPRAVLTPKYGLQGQRHPLIARDLCMPETGVSSIPTDPRSVPMVSVAFQGGFGVGTLEVSACH